MIQTVGVAWSEGSRENGASKRKNCWQDEAVQSTVYGGALAENEAQGAVGRGALLC